MDTAYSASVNANGNFAHVPVMLRESVDALNINANGIYVDGTLGGGGHSLLICEKLQSGKLIGIDRDKHAIAAASAKIATVHESFIPINDNFHNLLCILDSLEIPQINGLLLDLGVSSHQLDTPLRGFSYRHDGPLDMRMDTETALTAREIVNTYAEKELTQLFFTYGEERFSRRIARAIVAARSDKPIETTMALAKIIEAAHPQRNAKHLPHPATRCFQALRIAVNDELSPLENVLRAAVARLAPSGRIACITFHSLEDRIVKSTFASLASPCECPRDIPYCVCGKIPALRVITRKPITPSPEELSENRRAHSAKLRVAEKLDVKI